MTTVTQLPGRALERTVPQRLEALELANRVRMERARICRQVKGTGDRLASMGLIADLLDDPPAELRTMRVSALLRRGHQLGVSAATRLLITANISERTAVGGLTPRQRGVLCALLRGGDRVAA